jgi:transcriptional regulator with XRE-family HTH domain
VTDDPSPTLRRRELGAHLRRLRKERGWTTREVATRLGFSLSKVSRMETGARGVNARDMAALTKLFGVDDELAAHLDLIARTGKRRNEKRSAPVLETDYMSIEDQTFLDLERDAVTIREYNAMVVPGLLQTEEYMRAAMRGSNPDVAAPSIEASLATRLSRQRILMSDQRPEFEVIVDEAALRRQVGGRSVMRRQVESLRAAADEGLVKLMIIPFEVGSHPGVNSDFVALTLDDPLVPDVVFVEGLAGHFRFDRRADIERYERVWSTLKAVACEPEEAYGLLSSML